MYGIFRELLDFVWDYDLNWMHLFLRSAVLIADLDGQVGPVISGYAPKLRLGTNPA
jgi:hypothetical protein